MPRKSRSHQKEHVGASLEEMQTSSLEAPAGPEAEAGPVVEGEKKKANLWRRALGSTRRAVVDETKPFESVREAVHLFGRKDSAKVPKENITKSRGGSFRKMSLQEQLDELRHECTALQSQVADAHEAEKLKAAELAHFRSIAQRGQEVQAQHQEILAKSEADKKLLEAQLVQHEQELAHLREAKSALEVQLVNAKAAEERRVAELEKERQLKEDECQQARQLEQEASVKLESAIEQVKTLRRRGLELTEENQSKRELAAELSKAQEALRIAEGQIAKSKAAERTASKRAEQAQKDLEEAKSCRKVLEGELKEAKAALERAERDQAAREQRLRDAESELESSKAELTAAKARALKVESELEETVKALQAQLADAELALVAARDEAKAAQENISKLEKEVVVSEAEVERVRKSADSTSLELKEKLSTALGEVEQSNEAVKGLQARLSQAEQEVKAAEAEGSLKLAMVMKDIEALKARLAETVAEEAAAQVEASDLECKLAMVELDAKAAREGQKAAKAAVGVLKEQLEKGAKAALESAERDQAAREQRVRDAESQVEASKAELAAAEARALKAESELEEPVKGLRAQLADAQQALVAAREDAKAAQEQISKLEMEVAASEAEGQRVQESSDSTIVELKEKLSAALGELEQSKEAAKGLQWKLLQANEEMKVAEAEGSLKLAMGKKETGSLKARLAETVAEAEAAQVLASDLECKLAMVELDAKAAREGQRAAEAAMGVLKERLEKVEHLAVQRKGELGALQAQGIAETERRALVEAELKQKEECVAELEQQVKELEEVRASLEEEVAQKEEENADLVDQLRQLEDEKLVCMVEQVKMLQGRVVHAEQEAEAGKEGEALALDSVARCERFIADLKDKLTAAWGDREAATGLADQLEAELEVAWGRMEELEEKLHKEREAGKEEGRLMLAEELETKSLVVAELEERVRMMSEDKSQAMVACRSLKKELQVARKEVEEASKAFARLESKVALVARAGATADGNGQASGKVAVKKSVVRGPGVLERGVWVVVDGGLWVLGIGKAVPLVGRAVTAVEWIAVSYAQPLLDPLERKCLKKVVEVDNSICALFKAFDEHTPLVRLGAAALWPAQVAVSTTHQTLSLPWEALVVLKKGVATVKDELLSPVLGDLKQSGMMSALATFGVRLEPLLEQEVSLAFSFAEKIPVVNVFVPVLLPVGDRVLKMFQWAVGFDQKISRSVRRLQPAGPSTEFEG